MRQRLKCKSFDWFMKEIAFDQDKYYPAVEPEDSANGNFVFMYTPVSFHCALGSSKLIF